MCHESPDEEHHFVKDDNFCVFCQKHTSQIREEQEEQDKGKSDETLLGDY